MAEYFEPDLVHKLRRKTDARDGPWSGRLKDMIAASDTKAHPIVSLVPMYGRWIELWAFWR